MAEPAPGLPYRRADAALAFLVVLATLAAFLALAFSERGLAPLLALVVTLCRRTLSETLAHGADLGRALLLVPLGLGWALAAWEAWRLSRATWRWTASLGALRCAPDDRLGRLARRCAVASKVVLLRADQPFVFTRGLHHPQIWLSTGLARGLADDELEAVLRHEAHHAQARDPLKIMVVRCLCRALFFVPVARDLCDAYCVAKEIAADRHATDAMGEALPLARALRKLIASEQPAALQVGLVGEPGTTEARLLALLEPSRPLPPFPMRRLGLSLLWLGAVLVAAFGPAAAHLPSFAECVAPTALSLGIVGRL